MGLFSWIFCREISSGFSGQNHRNGLNLQHFFLPLSVDGALLQAYSVEKWI